MKFQRVGSIRYYLYKGKKLYSFSDWIDENGKPLTGAMGPAFDEGKDLMFGRYQVRDLIQVRNKEVHKL